MLAAVLSVVLIIACGGSGKDEVRASVVAIQAAINDRDYGRLFDDFTAESCRQGFVREAFIGNWWDKAFKLREVRLLDQNIVIDRGTAYLIVTATYQYPDGRSETATFQDELVDEDGHWRDADCFDGPLGGTLPDG